MPKYRIFLEGRQIDIDADAHRIAANDKNELMRVDFLDNAGHILGSFCRPALQGFVEIPRLLSQKE